MKPFLLGYFFDPIHYLRKKIVLDLGNNDSYGFAFIFPQAAGMGIGLGYVKALAKYKLADSELVIECGPDDELNRENIRQLLQGKTRPDAIFAAVEKFAVNTYEVCRELEIRVPQQLKVINFSNLSAAALFNPPLSTIVQPAYDMGREAANILFKIIDKKKLLSSERKIVIASHLVIRESTTVKQYAKPPVALK